MRPQPASAAINRSLPRLTPCPRRPGVRPQAAADLQTVQIVAQRDQPAEQPERQQNHRRIEHDHPPTRQRLQCLRHT